MKVTRFEDLSVWKISRLLVQLVYRLTEKEKIKKDYGFKDQLQRASISIMNNIAEGFERDNNKEFIKFLIYSKGSAGEVRSLLYVALDLNYIDENELKKAYEMSIDVITQVANFIKYLQKHITN